MIVIRGAQMTLRTGKNIGAVDRLHFSAPRLAQRAEHRLWIGHRSSHCLAQGLLRHGLRQSRAAGRDEITLIEDTG
jgi:hypothetical protein